LLQNLQQLQPMLKTINNIIKKGAPEQNPINSGFFGDPKIR
jgi:hypothetical protein